MPIIYTYPLKAIPNANDLILISDSQAGNDTKQIKVSTLPGSVGAGVSSVTSSNAAITIVDPTSTPVLTSTAYTGGTNIGHVPTGGSATTFLRGDGDWIVPTNTTYTGSWTPVMFGSVGETATTSGTYVQNGRKVTAWFYINCTTGGNTANKPSRISGLPINAAAVNGSRGSGIINNNTAVNAAHNFISAKSGGGTTIDLTVFTSSSDYQMTTSTWPSTSGDTFTVEGQFEYYSVA